MVFVIHWLESAMGVHVSPSWTPLPPPSPSHPSGLSQCTSPEHLSHASNLDGWFISHMAIYMFQCYSLKSSHPRLLHRVQKSVLYNNSSAFTDAVEVPVSPPWSHPAFSWMELVTLILASHSFFFFLSSFATHTDISLNTMLFRFDCFVNESNWLHLSLIWSCKSASCLWEF